MTGVPDPLDLDRRSRAQDAPELVLVSHPTGRSHYAPEIEARRPPQLAVWIQIHGYLDPLSQADAVSNGPVKNWFGRWMPEVAEPHNLLLGAHPDDPEWAGADGEIAVMGTPTRTVPPYGYSNAPRGTAEPEPRATPPPKNEHDRLRPEPTPVRRARTVRRSRLHLERRLRGRRTRPFHRPGRPGHPRDAARPRSAAHSRWDDNLWTVLVGNELHESGMGSPGEEYRWVSASASYILVDGRVKQIEASAARYKPGQGGARTQLDNTRDRDLTY